MKEKGQNSAGQKTARFARVKTGRWAGWCENFLFPVILLLYPLRHIRFGVEWWDTGYNYGNFLYMDQMDPMWMFSTYLGNALGNLFTRLPFGDRMLGLNIYTGLLVSLLALAGYRFFRKKLQIPAWIAFLGEFLAVNLCWCPTALLYNYLTYVLFGAGVIALYYGLWEKKTWCLSLAGVFLGINVFVRFPNLAQMGLIVGVWAFGIIQKEKVKKILSQTGWCILGYVLGAGVCLGYLSIRYGLEEYVSAVVRLLSMPSDASNYTPVAMVAYIFRNFLQNLEYLGVLAAAVLLATVCFAVLPGRLLRVKKAGFVACMFLLFYELMQHNMFNMKYSTKLSVFQWAVFLLTATCLIGAVTLLQKNAEEKDKLMLGMGILIILITPLGSNNHLYSSINNLFFVAPYTLYMLVRILKRLRVEIWSQVWGQEENGTEKISGKVGTFLREKIGTLSVFPTKAMLLGMLFMLTVQSLGFGLVYVFSESDGGENLNTPIGNNQVLAGMLTSPDRAQVLSELSLYVEENGLQGQELITYGQIPALSYYLQMPFAITSWPDLASYQYSVMEEDLEELSEQILAGEKSCPVILLEAGLSEELEAWLAEDGTVTALSGNSAADSEGENDKFTLLMEWAGRYSYKVCFRNDKFILLQTAEQ